MNSSKRRCICLISLFLGFLVLVGSLTAVIDPFFHYHAPLPFFTYPIENQRYQNNGIVRHFSYDAVITGTSMTENFKASEMDALFGVTTVKTCFSGATLKETGDHLRRALQANPDIRMVLRGIDGWSLFDHKDLMRTDASYPEYLYDDDLLNDVHYLFNKQILLEYTMEVLKHTLKGEPTTDFDSYSSWDSSQTGRELVLSRYDRPEKSGDNGIGLTEEEKQNITDTLHQNVIALARENPDVRFYCFFTPYSIYYMDYLNQQGLSLKYFQAYALATQLLLEQENIVLFSFFSDYDTVTDPDRYTDITHYHAPVNSLLLQRMAGGEYRLTKENAENHWQQVSAYYLAYDYASLFP